MENQDGSSSAQIEFEMVGGHPTIPGYFSRVLTNSENDERYPGYFEDTVFDVVNRMTANCQLKLNGDEISINDIEGSWMICSAAKYLDPRTNN